VKCSRCKQDKLQDDFGEGKKKCKSCDEYWRDYYKANRTACIERAKYHLNKDRGKTNKTKRALIRSNPVGYMLCAAKKRAKTKNLPFDLKHEDILIPEICPVLGISLAISEGKCSASSPSLDRLIPELGYVKGNVRVISHKANTIKSNATVSELELVASYLRRETAKN